MTKLVAVLAVALTAGAIALSADLFRLAGLSLYTEQYLAALMAIATALVFLHIGADGTKGRSRVPWYDALAALAGFLAAAYLAWRSRFLRPPPSARGASRVSRSWSRASHGMGWSPP